MKLQKQLSRKVGDSTYHKYVVVVPTLFVKILHWEEDTELKCNIRDGKLVIEKV